MYDAPDMTTTTGARINDVRRLMGVMTGDEKHGPAATSTLDVLWVLYDQVMRIDPTNPDDPDRDRFFLSKGHGPMAYYATLAATGFVDESWLADWGRFDSPLGHHPDRTLVPGVEISSGSLGHGLPLAVGAALGLRAVGRDARVFVLVGDAELDEGSNQEAIELAGFLGLSRLTMVVVDNASASYRDRGHLGRRLELEGWRTETVDGRDHGQLRQALSARSDRPSAVVAEVEEKWS